MRSRVAWCHVPCDAQQLLLHSLAWARPESSLGWSRGRRPACPAWLAHGAASSISHLASGHMRPMVLQLCSCSQCMKPCMYEGVLATTMLTKFYFFPGEASTACPCRFCIAFLAMPFLAGTCNPRMSNHAMCGVPSCVARRRVWCRRLGLHDPVARVLQQRIPQIRVILPGVLLPATKT